MEVVASTTDETTCLRPVAGIDIQGVCTGEDVLVDDLVSTKVSWFTLHDEIIVVVLVGVEVAPRNSDSITKSILHCTN